MATARTTSTSLYGQRPLVYRSVASVEGQRIVRPTAPTDPVKVVQHTAGDEQENVKGPWQNTSAVELFQR